MHTHVYRKNIDTQGCKQIGKAVSVPPVAILAGLLILVSFCISPAIIDVSGTDWVEPALIWLTVCMPTGSRKTTIYKLLSNIMKDVRKKLNLKGEDIASANSKTFKEKNFLDYPLYYNEYILYNFIT